MDQNIKGNGISNPNRNTAEAVKFGQMAVFMKAIGNLIKQMDVAGLYMLTGIFMMGIGVMTRLMVEDYIYILVVHRMMVIGMMINSMDTELRNGLMEHYMMDSIQMEKKTGKVIFCGLINQVMKDNFLIIIYMVMVHINGQMEGSIQVFGKKIKCMEMEVLVGQMEENMKVNMSMTKKKGKEFSLGTMVVCTLDIGLMEHRKE